MGNGVACNLRSRNAKLKQIYRRKDGYCWYCGVKLSFTNYGTGCLKGAWEVDHRRPRSRGGSDDIKNLVPICYYCNREKGNRLGGTFRAHIKRNWSSMRAYHAAMRRKYSP